MSLLKVEALNVRHGLLQAVCDVGFKIGRSEIVAFVGANGAGKTTLFRALAGAHMPASGRVVLDGADVTSIPDHQRVKRGIALVPEGRHLFKNLTVYENLVLANAAGRKGAWTIESVFDVFPNLVPHLKQKAGTLSGGEQQAAAIGRALITNPDVLLLDEVSLGLSPAAVENVYASIGRLVGAATTILLVEQDLDRALSVATRVICMLEGRVVLEDAVGKLSREQIIEAYFGTRQTRSEGVTTQ